MRETYGNVDAILVQGDMLVHGLSVYSSSTPNNWQNQKPVVQAMLNAFKVKFPDTPLLVSIGNNDVLVHYSAPIAADKTMFYNDLYDMIFMGHPGNIRQANLADIEPKFKEGGFYRYDIGDQLSVLDLNSIYFNYRNSEDLVTASSQLAWLEAELAGNPYRMFLISMHIPPMLFYFNDLDDFWK
jgi:hypothetical protein